MGYRSGFELSVINLGLLGISQVSGCTVINAFDARPRFEAEMMRRLDANITAFFYRTGAGEWLGLRMEIIGAAMLVLTSLILGLVNFKIKGEDVHAGLVTWESQLLLLE